MPTVFVLAHGNQDSGSRQCREQLANTLGMFTLCRKISDAKPQFDLKREHKTIFVDVYDVLSTMVYMSLINKFVQLFKQSAPKEAPVSGTPKQPTPDSRIEYITHVINRDNIDEYRSGRRQMIGGASACNIVTVYRYDIDPELNLQPDDEIYEATKMIRAEEPKTIKHELKHAANARFGHPCFISENYYEISGLYAFDEVSAYATAYLDNKTPTFENVCRAVYHGIDDLLLRKDWYIQRHMQQTGRKLMLNCVGKDYDTIKQHIEQNLQPRYGNVFNKTVFAYLTFDGQCLYGHDKKLSVELKQKLSLLRQTYEAATRATLQRALDQMATVHGQ